MSKAPLVFYNGLTAVFSLTENASAGVRWQVRPGHGLQSLTSSFNAPSSGTIGGAGHRTFDAVAAGRGAYTVTLDLVRPFPPQTTLDTVTVSLKF